MQMHLLQAVDISLDICCPYMVNKLIPLFHQDFHRGSPIRTSQVLHPMDTGVGTVDILVLLEVRTCNCCTTIVQVTYPVHDGQVHPHGENSRGKMNPLGDVTEELVVEGLNPERVSTLHFPKVIAIGYYHVTNTYPAERLRTLVYVGLQ